MTTTEDRRTDHDEVRDCFERVLVAIEDEVGVNTLFILTMDLVRACETRDLTQVEAKALARMLGIHAELMRDTIRAQEDDLLSRMGRWARRKYLDRPQVHSLAQAGWYRGMIRHVTKMREVPPK